MDLSDMNHRIDRQRCQQATGQPGMQFSFGMTDSVRRIKALSTASKRVLLAKLYRSDLTMLPLSTEHPCVVDYLAASVTSESMSAISKLPLRLRWINRSSHPSSM